MKKQGVSVLKYKQRTVRKLAVAAGGQALPPSQPCLAALAQAALNASVMRGGVGSVSKLPMSWYSSCLLPVSTRRYTCAKAHQFCVECTHPGQNPCLRPLLVRACIATTLPSPPTSQGPP